MSHAQVLFGLTTVALFELSKLRGKLGVANPRKPPKLATNQALSVRKTHCILMGPNTFHVTARNLALS